MGLSRQLVLGKQFDKIKFINDWEIKDLVIKPNTLIVTSPESEILGHEIKELIS